MILLLVVAAARPLVVTIEDAGFFLHFQTGTWILEHRALPKEFLFSLTAISLLRVALMALLRGSLALRSARRDVPVFLGVSLLGIILMRIFPFEWPMNRTLLPQGSLCPCLQQAGR